MEAIVTENLTKHYGRRLGVDRLSLSVPPGQVFGFLGPNGAGKTTTIRLLLGFLHPTGGTARVLDRDAWSDSHRIKQEVGYLPGDFRLYSNWTGRVALRIVGHIREIDLTDAGRELAEYFDLDLDVRVRSMSRGMRQKLGLLLSMAHRPRLLVLDEPTSGLDPIIQDRLRQRLRDLAAQGHTIFFSSHTLSEVEEVCDRVGIVRRGRLVADEPLDVLRDRARRQVEVRWGGDSSRQPPQAPPFLKVLDGSTAVWEAELTGSVPELIRWASNQPIADMSIGRPDLETLFRRYYREQDDRQ